jgi:uncharacterized protein involved in exopolysaccharide biosynthesis
VYDERDEVSLRELYLTVRRGLPLIVVVTIVAAAAAFLVVGLRPVRYRAEAVVRVTVPQLGGGSLPVDTTIGFDTYRRVAMSATVLNDALSRLDDTALDLRALRSAGSVERVNEGNGSALVAAMGVTLPSAVRAAAAANAWAAAASDAIRASLKANIEGVRASVENDLSQRGEALTQAEAGWEAFTATDERDALNAQLRGLDTRRLADEQRIDDLDRQIAATRARQEITTAIVAARQGGSPAPVEQQLQALQQADVLDEASASALASAVALTPDARVAGADLATVVARVRLQDDAATLAANSAERQAITARIAGLQTEADRLRKRLAALGSKASAAQRELENARTAYQQLEPLAPQLAALLGLAQASPSILDAATPPPRPLGRGRAPITAAAAAVAFFLMLFLVLARVAIAEPRDAHAAPRATPPRAPTP